MAEPHPIFSVCNIKTLGIGMTRDEAIVTAAHSKKKIM